MRRKRGRRKKRKRGKRKKRGGGGIGGRGGGGKGKVIGDICGYDRRNDVNIARIRGKGEMLSTVKDII